MRDEFRLLIVVGKAAVITIVGLFAADAVALVLLGSKIVATDGKEEILGVAIVFLSAIAVWIAARWMFRTLQAHFTKREARAVATAFAGFSPVWLGTAMLLGYYPVNLLTPFGRVGTLAGVFGGVAAVATLVSFPLCLLTLRITRRIVKVESTYA